jgi:alkyl hydroperoxide reductase subunit D
VDALVAGARAAGVSDGAIDDAKAAATLMASNNVFYRFRHFIAKPGYQKRHPRLRMERVSHPAASRLDLELFALAASAINGCEVCVQDHERKAIEGGLTEEHVHEVIRIAATMHAVAVALELELEIGQS